MKAAELRERLRKVKGAEEKVDALLAKSFSRDDKDRILTRIGKLAREWLECIREEGRVSHHVTDAFEAVVLMAFYGDDIYRVTEPLRDDW